MFGEGLAAVHGGIDKPGGNRVGNGLQNHQIAQTFKQVDGEATRFVAGFNHGIDVLKQRGLIALRQRGNGVIQQGDIRDAQQWTRNVIGQTVGTRTGKQLVQDRQRVTRGPAAGGNDHRVDGILNKQPFRSNGALQQALHRGRSQQAEWVMVRTGTDGANDLVRFRGRKNKDEMLWWFLNNLQQGIKALVGHHVGLIDDEDTIAGIRRRVIGTLTQLTHVFHRVVRCRVQLSYVKVSRATRGQGNTAGALPTRG